MKRISEEQKAILNCYSGTKEEVTDQLRKSIPFIEDSELRESAQELLELLPLMTAREYKAAYVSVLADVF